MADAQKRTTSRRDLARNPRFEQVSPDVGELDEAAVEEGMVEEPDEMLSLLADLTAATDPVLRELARRLAGRLALDVSRRGRSRPKGVGKLARQKYRPDGGDIDLDASLDAVIEGRARHGAPDPEGLHIRGWVKPGTALCLLVDRSGSMGGRPLATSAVAAAAVAWRAPADYSVLAFARDVVAAKSQDAPKPSDQVVADVLSLRGFGTTDVAGALLAAQAQLGRTRAGRKVAILLSDCRHTVDGDPIAAAAGLEELVIIAPTADADEARAFAGKVGAKLVTIDGPSDIPDALAAALGD